MDQILQSVGLSQNPNNPLATPPITGQELILRGLAGVFPPPGKLRVPNTALGRIGGGLARFGQGVASTLGQELGRQRTDPNQRFLNAIQAIPFDPVLGTGQARLSASISPGQPGIAGPAEILPALPPDPARTLRGQIARVPPGKERASQFALEIARSGSTFRLPERPITVPRGADVIKPTGELIRRGLPHLQGTVGLTRERFVREPGGESLVQKEEIVGHNPDGSPIWRPLGSAVSRFRQRAPVSREIKIGDKVIEVEISSDPSTGKRIVRDALTGKRIPIDAQGRPDLSGITSIAPRKGELDELMKFLRSQQAEKNQQLLSLRKIKNLREQIEELEFRRMRTPEAERAKQVKLKSLRLQADRRDEAINNDGQISLETGTAIFEEAGRDSKRARQIALSLGFTRDPDGNSL